MFNIIRVSHTLGIFEMLTQFPGLLPDPNPRHLSLLISVLLTNLRLLVGFGSGKKVKVGNPGKIIEVL